MTHERALDALADPIRRQLMERLRAGPMAVGRLAEGLPVTRPAVSQHLKVLKTAGLVSDHRAGTRNLYRIAPAGLADLRAYLDTFWDDVLGCYAEAVRNGAPDEGKPPKTELKKETSL